MAILQDGQVISGGVGVVHLKEAQYLADKTNYDKSGNFIILDDVDETTYDDAVYADDTIAETSASVRDADTLGGQYSANDITNISNNLVNVKSKTYTAKGLTFEFKKVGTTVQVYCSGTSTESGAYTDTFFTVSDEFKPIMLMWGRCAFATDVVFYIDTTGKFSTTGTTLQKGQDIRFSMTYASAC